MSQLHSKRVYSGQDIEFLRYLSATDDYLKELGEQSSLLLLLQDGLDQQQLGYTFQNEHPSAANQAMPEQGSEQFQVNGSSDSRQNSAGIVKFFEKGKGRPKRSVLSEEEKRERKRQNDAKYRRNKILKNKMLKDENIMLKNMVKASEQAKDSEALSLHELLQDVDVMQAFPIVLEDRSQRNLGENQSLTRPQDAFHPQLPFVTQNDIQSQSLVENQPITYFQDGNQGVVSVLLQDNPQRALSAVLQNDAGKSLEHIQILTQPEPELVPACCLTFVEKLKRDERSTVSYSDFKTMLQGETREMGGYRIPLLLQPIFENIVTSYGDITSNSLLSSFSAENVLLQFLATIKEMGDTSFEQVTEDRIFKWKGCITDAQLIKFNVDFATEHLNKIVKSYLSRKARNQLSSFDERIKVLETELNDLKREKLEIEMFQSQLLIASEEFQGNVGLF